MSNLNLIDWGWVGLSALWLVGLGLVLATLSRADYDAAHGLARFGAALQRPGMQLALNAGLALFCLGLLGISGAIWERLGWIGLALWFAFQAWLGGRNARLRPPPHQD